MHRALPLLRRPAADQPMDTRPGRKGSSRDGGKEGGGREEGRAPDVTSATTAPQGPPGHGNLACLHPELPPSEQRAVLAPAWDLQCMAESGSPTHLPPLSHCCCFLYSLSLHDCLFLPLLYFLFSNSPPLSFVSGCNVWLHLCTSICFCAFPYVFLLKLRT